MNIILSLETAKDLFSMVDNYREINEFPNEHNKQQLNKLYCALAHAIDLPRISIRIQTVELVPLSTDLMLNYTIDQLLALLEADDSSADELINAVWEYLLQVHHFDCEQHDLLKHTTEEALTFAIDFLEIRV